MSLKTLALVTLAVVGTLVAVHVAHNQHSNTDTDTTHELHKLSNGTHPVNYKMLFTHYKKTQNLTFGSAEEATRFLVFKANCDKIVAHNANRTSTYRLGLTPLAHLTQEEFAATRLGYTKKNVAVSRNAVLLDVSDVPTEVDWTTKGAVTPVKDQGTCGSCWSFSATGSLEGAHAISKGELLSFSEQELVDCSAAQGNEGCNGGLMDQAFKYVQAHGLASEGDYPYTGTDGTCKTGVARAITTIAKFTDVAVNDPEQLQAAIALQPVSIAIEADTFAFQLYSTGVITGDACGTQLDHGVLAVGYGTQDGTAYTKVKNSWGASWGANGYVLIGVEKGAGVCGINSDPSYPTF